MTFSRPAVGPLEMKPILQAWLGNLTPEKQTLFNIESKKGPLGSPRGNVALMQRKTIGSGRSSAVLKDTFTVGIKLSQETN